MPFFSRPSNIQWAAVATIIAAMISVLIFLFGDGILKNDPADANDHTAAIPDSDRIKIVHDQVQIELTSIVRAGSKLRIDYLVTALERDQKWLLYGSGRTRAITPAGDEFKHCNVKLGTAYRTSDVTTELIKGVPIKAFHEFDNFPTDAAKLAVLEITGRYFDHDWIDWSTRFPPLQID